MYDYRYEPHRVIFMIDNKSFYASCEAISRGLNPMKAVLCVLSVQPESNPGSGLIMAASPVAKAKYGLTNVMRARDLPAKAQRPDLMLVAPHMNLYLQKSMAVYQIFRDYAADEDIHVYSIDESMIDMTASWHLFGDDPYLVARRIQKQIKNKLGLYTTCGIGENPLLAKLAMDISAKHRRAMIANWHYIDVPDTVWRIPELEMVCGINHGIAKRLHQIGLHNLYEVAHAEPQRLIDAFGTQMGSQLFAMSWGVDRACIRQKVVPQNKSYGNSQVLSHDYLQRREIELVIREIGEQVAARIRAHHLKTQRVALVIHYSWSSQSKGRRDGFHVAQSISATNGNADLVRELLALFRHHWDGSAVRMIAISYHDLSLDLSQQLELFTPAGQQIKHRQFDQTIDQIRRHYGLTSLVKASSLLPGATAIQRSGLVGGHNGGNAYE